MPSPISRLLRSFLVALVLSVVGTLSFAAGQGDSPIYVNAAASGANNGTSWQNAYPICRQPWRPQRLADRSGSRQAPTSRPPGRIAPSASS